MFRKAMQAGKVYKVKEYNFNLTEKRQGFKRFVPLPIRLWLDDAGCLL
jgi:hypothetical protein